MLLWSSSLLHFFLLLLALHLLHGTAARPNAGRHDRLQELPYTNSAKTLKEQLSSVHSNRGGQRTRVAVGRDGQPKAAADISDAQPNTRVNPGYRSGQFDDASKQDRRRAQALRGLAPIHLLNTAAQRVASRRILSAVARTPAPNVPTQPLSDAPGSIQPASTPLAVQVPQLSSSSYTQPTPSPASAAPPSPSPDTDSYVLYYESSGQAALMPAAGGKRRHKRRSPKPPQPSPHRPPPPTATEGEAAPTPVVGNDPGQPIPGPALPPIYAWPAPRRSLATPPVPAPSSSSTGGVAVRDGTVPTDAHDGWLDWSSPGEPGGSSSPLPSTASPAWDVSGAGAPPPPALAVSLPATWDARNKSLTGGLKIVSPVRFQASCSACVAFTVLAAAETALALATRQGAAALDFSEQHLFFCGPQAAGLPPPSCIHGWSLPDALTVLQRRGAFQERCWPYDVTRGSASCAAPAAPCAAAGCAGAAASDGGGAEAGVNGLPVATAGCGAVEGRWEVVSHDWYGSGKVNVTAAKEVVTKTGSAMTCFRLYEDMYRHRGGVYRWDGVSTWLGYHCAQLIGWDDPKAYWLFKSSWGTEVGDKGFFKMAYGEAEVMAWGVYGLVWKPPSNELT